MAGVYDSMAATFLKDGLNLAAIAAISQFYCNVDAQPDPLFYEHFPTPLEQGAVRLVVFQPVQADLLVKLAHSACHDILSSLVPGMLLPQVMHADTPLHCMNFWALPHVMTEDAPQTSNQCMSCPECPTMLLHDKACIAELLLSIHVKEKTCPPPFCRQ